MGLSRFRTGLGPGFPNLPRVLSWLGTMEILPGSSEASVPSSVPV